MKIKILRKCWHVRTLFGKNIKDIIKEIRNKHIKTRNRRLYEKYAKQFQNDEEAFIAPFEELTCSSCPEANKCEYAFDPFNNNLDCIMDK